LAHRHDRPARRAPAVHRRAGRPRGVAGRRERRRRRDPQPAHGPRAGVRGRAQRHRRGTGRLMSATPAHEWRGVAGEEQDDLPGRISSLLRKRSRRLLGSLLHPHRRTAIWLVAIVLLTNAATMAGPWLVGLAIDKGIPAAADHHPQTLFVIV